MIDAAPSDATANEVSFSWKQLALIESDKWDRPPMAAPARVEYPNYNKNGFSFDRCLRKQPCFARVTFSLDEYCIKVDVN